MSKSVVEMSQIIKEGRSLVDDTVPPIHERLGVDPVAHRALAKACALRPVIAKWSTGYEWLDDPGVHEFFQRIGQPIPVPPPDDRT